MVAGRPLPPRIPDIVTLLAGDEPDPVWQNERGGLTFRAGDRFIKWSPRSSGIDLDVERERLLWAGRHTSVPRVLDFGSDEEAQWLVTAALPGVGAVTDRWLAEPLTAVRAIGRGLRMLHDALPVADCPYEWSRDSRLERSTGRELPIPSIDQLVVCHGDACAPNTIIGEHGEPAGHVDLGRLGLADRWADLAVASMSLGWNYGPHFETEFFAAYGIDPGVVLENADRIRFYRWLWDHDEDLPAPEG